MMEKDILQLIRKSQEKDFPKKPQSQFKCVGKIFRCRTTTFSGNHNQYQYSLKMSMLKRKSCPGCTSCGGLIEAIENDIHESEGRPLQLIPPEPVDQALYSLEVINESIDYVTGFVDGYDVIFRKIEP